jgi:hypothetical protein
MHPSLERPQLAALRTRERQDGTVFTFAGAAAIGILGVPSVEAQLTHSGPAERIAATLTVRRAWLAAPPVAGDMPELAVFDADGLAVAAAARAGAVPAALVAGTPARRYLVTSVNLDDPLAYEFTLLDRN